MLEQLKAHLKSLVPSAKVGTDFLHAYPDGELVMAYQVVLPMHKADADIDLVDLLESSASKVEYLSSRFCRVTLIPNQIKVEDQWNSI